MPDPNMYSGEFIIMKNIRVSVFILFFTLPVLINANNNTNINILIQPFQNNSRKNYNWISAGIADCIVSDLLKLRSINVFTENDRKKALQEIELGMSGIIKESDTVKLGYIMGANIILTGSYTIVNNNIRIISKLIDVKTAKVINSSKIDGNINKIFQLQDKIVLSLISSLEKNNNIKIATNSEKNKALLSKNPNPEAFKHFSMAIILIETSPAKALQEALLAIKKDPEYADALILTGSLYSYTGDPVTANQYFKKAINIYKVENKTNSIKYALLLYNIALNKWNSGNWNDSLQRSLQAKSILEKNSKTNSSLYASVLLLIGSSYRSGGNLIQDYIFTRKAAEILEKLNLDKTSNYAWVLSNLGVNLLSSNKYQSALATNFKALKIWEELNMKKSSGYAFTYCQTGNIYIKLKEFDKAEQYLAKGMQLCRDLNLHNTVQYAYYSWNLAIIYWHKEDYCKGIQYMENTVKILEKLGNPAVKQAKAALNDFKKQCRK